MVYEELAMGRKVSLAESAARGDVVRLILGIRNWRVTPSCTTWDNRQCRQVDPESRAASFPPLMMAGFALRLLERRLALSTTSTFKDLN